MRLTILFLLLAPTTVLAQTPTVVSTVPTLNELGASVSADISVTFDIDMDAGTIDGSTFVANGLNTGPHPGTISYDAPSRTATLDPAVDFIEGEIVTVVLTDGVESSGGDPLDGFAWAFTTTAAVAPATFPVKTDYPGGIVASLMAADLDGDGDLDLATADQGGVLSVLQVSLNNGNGTFVAPAIYFVTGNTWPVIASDFDGDDDLDLAAGDNNGSSFSLLPNNGDGTFAPEVVVSTPRRMFSLAAADFDADGDSDLVMGGTSFVTVLLNDGGGTFTVQTDYAVTSGGLTRSVFTADLDADGDVDVVATDDNVISVFMNQGDGTFAAGVTYPAGTDPSSVYAADLNGDSDIDLAVTDAVADGVSVLLNQGAGTFAAPVAYATGVEPRAVSAADLDGDGDLDLAVANLNFGVVDGKMSLLFNNGNGTFASAVDVTVGESPVAVVSAELDGDGDIDLAVANRSSGDISVLLNLGVVAVPPTPIAGGIHVLRAPTPSTPPLRVRFAVPEAMPVTAEVVSVTGRRVRLLATRQPFEPGVHELEWDGRSDEGRPAASGVYYVRLTTRLGTESAQTILVR